MSNQRPLFENLYKNIVPELLAAHGDLEITIRPYKAKRSYEQNRRLWSLYNQIAEQVWLDGRRYEAAMWHEYFKQQFIGCDERVLPNGEIQKIGLSTTQLMFSGVPLTHAEHAMQHQHGEADEYWERWRKERNVS